MSDKLRLSDAERETASSALGEHYAQGRLDADEHAERHERIWAARTIGEIPSIFEDLPGGSPLQPVTTRQGGGTRRTPPRPRSRRGGLPLPLKALLAVALVVLVIKGWPAILIGLGVLWLLSHRGHGRCAPTSRRYSTG